MTDVDQNWSNERVNPVEDKTFREEWDLAITMCEKNGYSYAVSNPFFEIWLLLHHDNPSEEDRRFAVSKEHGYEKTNHFRKRLTDLGVPLKNQKHINERDYDDEKVRTAIRRAEELHIDKQDLCPEYLATTVYMLVKKMVDMIPNIKANGTNSVRT